MVKKKDLVKILYIYICFCHVCPGHPCGDNPLRNFIVYAERTGRNLPSLLGTVRYLNAGVFKQLQRDYRTYAECLGMVDTGYFKRSLPISHAESNLRDNSFTDESDLNEVLGLNDKFENEIPSQTKEYSRLQSLRQTSRLLQDGLYQYLMSKSEKLRR